MNTKPNCDDGGVDEVIKYATNNSPITTESSHRAESYAISSMPTIVVNDMTENMTVSRVSNGTHYDHCDHVGEERDNGNQNSTTATTSSPTFETSSSSRNIGNRSSSLATSSSSSSIENNSSCSELLEAELVQSLGLEGIIDYSDGNKENLILPSSIDELIVKKNVDSEDCEGENDGQIVVQLTERQQKSMQNRLNTLQKQAKLNSRPGINSIQWNDIDTIKMGCKTPSEIDGHVSSNVELKSKQFTEVNNVRLRRDLAQYKSSPNLLDSENYKSGSRDRFSIWSSNNSGRHKNFRGLQKLRNLFSIKSKQKAFEIPANEYESQDKSENSRSRSSSTSQQFGATPNSNLDKRIQPRYFKYKDSYRKSRQRKVIPQIYFPLEYVPVEDDSPLLNTTENSALLADFGAEFTIKNSQIVSYALRQNVTPQHDLTKNLAYVASKVALLELEADLEPWINSVSPPKMPRFSQTRKKINPNFIFGGYLTQLHNLDNKHGDYEYPSVLKHMIEYLTENALDCVGIFRISGTISGTMNLQEELGSLYQSYYKQNKPHQKEEIFDIFAKYTNYEVASLLKQFIRQLAQPLLTNELMEIFLFVSTVPQVFSQIKILNLLMLLLNESHRNTLCALLDFFYLVAEHEQNNKMTLDNVVKIMAPNLFVSLGQYEANYHAPQANHHHLLQHFYNQDRSNIGSRLLTTKGISFSSQSINEISPQLIKYMEYSKSSLNVLKLMINLKSILFHVPPHIYRQIKFNDN